MLTLTIIRHAKTNQESISGKDFDRDLLPRGVAQCEGLSAFLKTSSFNHQVALVSTAKRTQRTFELIKLSVTIKKVEENELYLASHQELLKYLWNIKQPQNVVLIGHNYGISDLATYITGEHIDLGTSELIHIELPIDDWSELSNGHGSITSRYRPRA